MRIEMESMRSKRKKDTAQGEMTRSGRKNMGSGRGETRSNLKGKKQIRLHNTRRRDYKHMGQARGEEQRGLSEYCGKKTPVTAVCLLTVFQ